MDPDVGARAANWRCLQHIHCHYWPYAVLNGVLPHRCKIAVEWDASNQAACRAGDSDLDVSLSSLLDGTRISMWTVRGVSGGSRFLWRWGFAALLSSSLPLLEDRRINTSMERSMCKVRAFPGADHTLTCDISSHTFPRMMVLGPGLSAGLPNKTCAEQVGGSAFLPSCLEVLPSSAGWLRVQIQLECPDIFRPRHVDTQSSKIRQSPPRRLPNGPILSVLEGLQ